MLRKLARLADIALPQLDAQLREGGGEARALEQRARRGEQDPDLTATQSLERFHTLSRHLHVRLDFAKPFARRVHRDRGFVEQGVKIREQALRLRHPVGDDDQEPVLDATRQRRHECSIGGTGQARNTKLACRFGQGIEHTGERGEAFDRVDQSRE